MHSPYTLSCKVWVKVRPPTSTISTEKLPLSPDSSGPSSRLRLLCSWARPRKREWYRVSREPRKNVARSSSEGQRDLQMASRTWKLEGCWATSSAKPPTLLNTWAPGAAMGRSAARTEPPVTLLAPGCSSSLLYIQLSCYEVIRAPLYPPSTQVEQALCHAAGVKQEENFTRASITHRGIQTLRQAIKINCV